MTADRFRRIAMRVRDLAHTSPWAIPPRHPDKWATHWPVLVGVSRLIMPSTVVEVGSGVFSTPAFLDSTAFPVLRHFRSYEDDAHWYERVRRLVGEDSRADLRLVCSPCGHAAANDGLGGADLVFVDDSMTVEGRTKSLSAVLAAASEQTIVVVHDFEVPAYVAAVSAPWRYIMIRGMSPCTGVVWRQRPWFAWKLTALGMRIWYHADRVSPRDTAAWVRIFSEHPFRRLVS